MRISKAFAIASASLSLASCELLTEYETEYVKVESVDATGTKTWNYSATSNVFEIDSDTLSVNINGDLGGKTLYYTLVNPENATIGYKKLRKVVDSALITETPSVPEFPHMSLDGTTAGATGKRHFVGEKLPEFDFAPARAATTGTQGTTSVVVDYDIGATKKIYVDTDESVSKFEEKNATLRAKGENCYVWVVDDYYSETAGGNKVGSTIAEGYAEKFDAMYPVITNVFGNESDKIIDYDSNQMVDIETVSNTGKKVNIVIYDIGADYKDEETVSTVGIVGYFYAKDYYRTTNTLYSGTVIGKSNVGKYFYIDSGYANANFGDTISTLAHEFQHMVNFNMKNIQHNLSPDTSYNEMLSMLCEDMMQEFLEIDDDNSPKSRIKDFNALYFGSGIREYRDDSNAALSYATSYAFGAWLCRQYGGATLVKEMMENEYANNESIVSAVNSVNGTSYTFDDLFGQFLRALHGDSDYTLNKDAEGEEEYHEYSTQYYYPMSRINIFSDTYSPQNIDGYTYSYGKAAYDGYKSGYSGPFVFSNDIYNIDLRPNYGIQMHAVGTYGSGTTSDTVRFTTSGANTLKIFITLK